MQRIFPWHKRSRQHCLKSAETLVILYTDSQWSEPFPARLRYHLLPSIRVDHIRPLTRGWTKRATRDYDFVLFVGDPHGAPLDPLDLLKAQKYEPTGRERVLVKKSQGVLLALNKQS